MVVVLIVSMPLCHIPRGAWSRAAPKLANPVTADEANLVAEARLYSEHCTLCHGDPAHPKSALADSLNPTAPQFTNDMADMPENQNFYIVQHALVILLTSSHEVMGKRVNSPLLRYLGWATFGVMTAAAVGMVLTS